MAEAAYQRIGFPHVVIRDTIIGEQAHVNGTGMKVWEIVRIARAWGGAEAMAEHFGLDPSLIEEALAYARCYPEGIEEAIEDNASYTLEKLRVSLPNIGVTTVRDADEQP